MEISNFLLIVSSLLYGFSGVISDWSDFRAKLANTLALIVIFTLSLVTCAHGIELFYEDAFNLMLPIPAIVVGYFIGKFIKSEDWKKVSEVVAVIGVVASVITAFFD